MWEWALTTLEECFCSTQAALLRLCVTLGPPQVHIFSCVNENVEWITCHRVNQVNIELKYDSFVSFQWDHCLPY